MKVQAILTFGATLMMAVGLVTSVGQPVSAAPDNDQKVTICHATNSHSNPYVAQSVSKSSIDEPKNQNNNGHGDHVGPVWQSGIADHSWGDIIPPFTYIKKNGQTASYEGMNWPAGSEWLANNCRQPGTPPIPVVDYCDPTQQPAGSVASWLANAGFNGADCFDYTIDQHCGYIDVQITRQPTPQYAQGPFYAVYTTDGTVTYIDENTFPATFPISEGGEPVEVTWFTAGPEKDYLMGTDFPNFWGRIGQTVVVDTDCMPGQGGGGNEGETPTKPASTSKPAAPAAPAAEQSVAVLPNTAGSSAPAALVGMSVLVGLVTTLAAVAKASLLARL